MNVCCRRLNYAKSTSGRWSLGVHVNSTGRLQGGNKWVRAENEADRTRGSLFQIFVLSWRRSRGLWRHSARKVEFFRNFKSLCDFYVLNCIIVITFHSRGETVAVLDDDAEKLIRQLLRSVKLLQIPQRHAQNEVLFEVASVPGSSVGRKWVDWFVLFQLSI